MKTRAQSTGLASAMRSGSQTLPMTAGNVFAASDGDLTKRFYAELEKLGPIGLVALNLFRAQKASSRAKVYRGGRRGVGRFKDLAYQKKSWSMANLCVILQQHSEQLGIRYGWGEDPYVPFGSESSWVLYIDLPNGQVSFHSPSRLVGGPDYPGLWDGMAASQERILNFCNAVMEGSLR